MRPAEAFAARPSVLGQVVAFVGLTKPRLNALTVFAVGAGWFVAGGSLDHPPGLLVTLAGAALVAGGASALNQWMERDRDAVMVRTAGRPLPSGRLLPMEALVFGCALSGAGLAALAIGSNLLTTALAALCLLSYVLVYTPLKTRTSLNTLVGTLPGALPPVMGVTAATGALPPAAAFLFALLVAWQLPHFLAIAWLHRRDYARGGYRMLPTIRGGEASTARQVVLQSLFCGLVSLSAAPLGLAGWVYTGVALAAGALLVGAGAAFALRRTDAAARRLLHASLVHLPLVLSALALDRAIG